MLTQVFWVMFDYGAGLGGGCDISLNLWLFQVASGDLCLTHVVPYKFV